MELSDFCEENRNGVPLKKSSVPEKNDINFNGLFIKGKLIPEEVLLEIFCYIDYKQLLVCHLVCKQWETLIKEHTWRKKAEIVSSQIFPIDEEISWTSYYNVCAKRPFNRNLLLSNKLKIDSDPAYEVFEFNKNVGHPSVKILPFPDDPAFEENIRCVIVPKDQYIRFDRKLVIDLLKEGFTEEILDILQPAVKISEWYCCNPEDERVVYDCSIKLLREDPGECYNRVMRVFHYNKMFDDVKKRGQWFQFNYTFKNYGEGLRTIKFYHGGNNGIIMAGACVKLMVPGFDSKCK